MVDLEIFPLLMQKQYQNTGISAAQLSEYTGAEQELIGIASYRMILLRARLTVTHSPFDAGHVISGSLHNPRIPGIQSE